MALTGFPKKTKFQVNTDTAYFLNGKNILSGLVVATNSEVADVNSDNTGEQTNTYFLEGQSREFNESELFISRHEAFYYLNGNLPFAETGHQTDFTGASEAIVMPYSNLEDCNFSAVVFATGSTLEGSSCNGSNFQSITAANCTFRNANLSGADFTGADITGVDFRGADLTSATMDTSFDSKAEFKSVVGAGKYDPETTIWTDGTAIGA